MEKITGLLIDGGTVILVRDKDDDTPRCPMYLDRKIGLDLDLEKPLASLEVSNPGCSHCWSHSGPSCPMFLKADMYGEWQKPIVDGIECYIGGHIVYVTCMAPRLSVKTIKRAFMDMFPDELPNDFIEQITG